MQTTMKPVTPPLLSPGLSCIAEVEPTWRAAHVRARAEKAFAAELIEAGIPYFLPMERRRVKDANGDWRNVQRVLFDGYVFVAPKDTDQIRDGLAGRHLCNFVADANPRRLRKELIDLHMVLSAGGGPLKAYNQPHDGERWRVSHGDFEGVEGIVIGREAKRAKFLLWITTLQGGYTLDIPLDWLEGPVGPVN